MPQSLGGAQSQAGWAIQQPGLVKVSLLTDTGTRGFLRSLPILNIPRFYDFVSLNHGRGPQSSTGVPFPLTAPATLTLTPRWRS